MSKDKISDYSATANSNTDIGGINIDEGCAPSGINDAIRTLMKQLKDFQQGTNSDPFNGPHNGTVGATTPASGAFTTLSASSTLSVTGAGTIQGLTVGRGAGAVSTNTAVGASALASNTTGSLNTAVGYQAVYSNTVGTVTGVGYQSLYSNTSGDQNTAIGYLSLNGNTTGSKNTGLGHGALQSNTTASNNTAVGYQAAYTNTTGNVLTAVGYKSLYSNTTGVENTAVGQDALGNNTTGAYNTGVGVGAGKSTTTGSSNTSLGWLALHLNTTASNNTAVGYQAGYTSNRTADAYGYNVFVGSGAGYSATTGQNNTFVGGYAGNAVTSGSKNTILGRYDGNQGGLDIRTSSNYIVLSDGDGNPRAYYNNPGNFWAFNNGGAANSTVFNVYNDNASTPYGVFVQFTAAAPNNTTNYLFRGQDSSTTCFTIWSNGTTSGRSDARLKKNIVDATPKLDDICRLQVRNYEWNESIDGHKEIGLIAQEVETVFPGLVVTHDLEKDGDDYKEVKYSALVPMLIKAIQELKAEIDTLKGQA